MKKLYRELEVKKGSPYMIKTFYINKSLTVSTLQELKLSLCSTDGYSHYAPAALVCYNQ